MPRHINSSAAEITDSSELLNRYVAAVSAVDAGDALELLFRKFVQPWCREVTGSALRRYALRSSERSEQAEETEAEVLLRVAERLNGWRAGTAEPISDLRAYTASCVYNACFHQLRASSPERARLGNRVRYLLRHDKRFAQWDASGEILGGLARWSGESEYRLPVAPDFPPREVDELCLRIFHTTGGPVAVGALVACMAEVLGILKTRPVELSDSTLKVAPSGVEAAIDQRQRLRTIWSELAELPQNQRTALLLNLRDTDGQGVIELIPATGIASLEELAAALGMSSAALAGLWNDLPLDDNRIAYVLGVQRQQVINLRKSARERIIRRITKLQNNIEPISASMSHEGILRSAGRVVSKMFGRGQ